MSDKFVVFHVNSPRMTRKQYDPHQETTRTDLDEARIVKARVLAALEACDESDIPKLTDSYSRISNAIRQLEKQRKKEITTFSDDEVVEHVQGLPERRHKAVMAALSGEDLSKKPLFGP